MAQLRHFWQEWRSTLLFILLLFTFRSVFADWYTVPTGSMKPTIIEGDRVFVNKLAYDIKLPFTLISLASWDKPKRGDVVVFDSPVEDIRLIKRVVGLPGDRIAIRDNQLFINDHRASYSLADQSQLDSYWESARGSRLLVQESFGDGGPHVVTWSQAMGSTGSYFGPVVVPAGHYFMLGDNRNNSADSRFIGPIDEKLILGKANKVVLSTQHSERFFQDLN